MTLIYVFSTFETNRTTGTSNSMVLSIQFAEGIFEANDWGKIYTPQLREVSVAFILTQFASVLALCMSFFCKCSPSPLGFKKSLTRSWVYSNSSSSTNGLIAERYFSIVCCKAGTGKGGNESCFANILNGFGTADADVLTITGLANLTIF